MGFMRPCMQAYKSPTHFVWATMKNSQVENYCPISILPILSKLLERHIYNCLMKHLNDHHPLSDNHHSLGMRTRQDYTNHVMLNDCISVRWSSMYTWLLHCLETVTLCLQGTYHEPGTDRRLFFSLLFPFQCFPCTCPVLSVGILTYTSFTASLAIHTL